MFNLKDLEAITNSLPAIRPIGTVDINPVKEDNNLHNVVNKRERQSHQQNAMLNINLRDITKFITEAKAESTQKCDVINTHDCFNNGVAITKTIKSDEIQLQRDLARLGNTAAAAEPAVPQRPSQPATPLIVFINNFVFNKLKLKKYIRNYTGIDAANKMYKMLKMKQIIKNISIPNQIVKKQNKFKLLINNLILQPGIVKTNTKGIQILQLLDKIRIKLQSLENLKTIYEIKNSD